MNVIWLRAQLHTRALLPYIHTSIASHLVTNVCAFASNLSYLSNRFSFLSFSLVLIFLSPKNFAFISVQYIYFGVNPIQSLYQKESQNFLFLCVTFAFAFNSEIGLKSMARFWLHFVSILSLNSLSLFSIAIFLSGSLFLSQCVCVCLQMCVS